MVQVELDVDNRKVCKCRRLEKPRNVGVGRKGSMCTFLKTVHYLPHGEGG